MTRLCYEFEDITKYTNGIYIYMKRSIQPPTQRMTWCLPGPAGGQHISHNITAPLLGGVPTNQVHQPSYVYSHVYWPGVYSTSENRRRNGIAFLMYICIGPTAYSTPEDGCLNSIVCLNAHICWLSHVRL